MWMFPGVQPAMVTRNKLSFQCIAAMGVIDAHGNIVHVETTPKSYDSEKVLACFRVFAKKAKLPCKLVLDNLACHRTHALRDFCESKGISIIFNGTYSSQYMPVERLWLFAKLYWRKEVANIRNFKDQNLLRRRIEACIW